MSQMHQGAYRLSVKQPEQVPFLVHVKNHDREVVFHTKGGGRQVHDLKSLPVDLFKGDLIIPDGPGYFLGVSIIHPVDTGPLEEDVGFDFGSAQGTGRVRGEIGVSGAPGNDGDLPLFKRFNGFFLGIILPNGLHTDRSKNAGRRSGVNKRRLQGQAVDYRGQHPHLVALHTVKSPGCTAHPPEDISPANDNAHLHPSLHDLTDFCGIIVQTCRIDSVRLSPCQRLPA